MIQDLERLIPSLPARLTREFHETFGLPIGDASREVNAFRAKLIAEEAAEVVEAIEEMNLAVDAADHMGYSPSVVNGVSGRNREMVAKELADAVIVLYGTALTMGVDLDEAVRLVHASNMSKVDASGKPLVREDGKVMKPPDYREPDMSGAVRP